MLYVIAYDISDDRKRDKISKILEKYGIKVQYSIVECDLSKATVKALYQQMSKIIDKKTDKIYLYPLDEECKRKVIYLGSREEVSRCVIIWNIDQWMEHKKYRFARQMRMEVINVVRSGEVRQLSISKDKQFREKFFENQILFFAIKYGKMGIASSWNKKNPRNGIETSHCKKLHESIF